MKVMLINTYGEDAVFEAADVNKPKLKTGHVLVKIAASSVNTIDTMIRKMGKELPFSPDTPAILGMDFAGTVEAVGGGVEDFPKAMKFTAVQEDWQIYPARWRNTWSRTAI